MASDIIQNWTFAEQKTVAATISIHTHTHTSPTLPKTSRISATIQSKFNFKNIFSHCIQCKKLNRLCQKYGGPGPPPPLGSATDNCRLLPFAGDLGTFEIFNFAMFLGDIF